MSAQPHDLPPAETPDPAKSLRAIRAALVVRQDREAFDAGLKAVLDEVRVNLDLGVQNNFMHRWWISACDSARDPDGRRRMHARAELFTLLETAPWSGEPFNPANPRGNMLTHAFGELGLATYLVLEDRREVYLLRIEWP